MHTLALVLVAWLPGTVVMRLPLGMRERRGALAAEERAFWAVIISATVSLTVTLALAAAHRFSLGRLVAVDVILAGGLAAAARFRLGWQGRATRLRLTALIPVALLALATWRFAPVSEYVIGGKDPGVYLNEGIQIAQRGALVAHDPVVAGVPAFARDLFFPRDVNRQRFLAVRFMGFYILDPDTGAVVGQFPHLFPASIAIGYTLDGLSGARLAVAWWAALGLLAVYFGGARLVGRPAAAIAAGLLALNVVEVWFARYPNSEVVMQALGFAAMLAAARSLIDGDRFFAPVAGALLGLLLFLRIDSLMLSVAIVSAVMLGRVAGYRMAWTFWPPLITAGALCLAYLGGPLREYSELPRVYLTNLPRWEHAGVVAAAVALLAGFLIAERSRRLKRVVTVWTPAVLVATVAVLAVYALLFRHAGGKLTDYDADALRTFARFYVTVPALLCAIAGYALLARERFWRDPPFILTFTAFSLFFFYKIRIWPDHFWMARRFVPVILPGTLLCVTAAVMTAWPGLGWSRRAIRLPIAVLFLGVLAIDYGRGAAPVVRHVEYAGIIARLEALSQTIGPDDLLIAESRNAGSDVHVLALPLAYIYARNVLVLAGPTPDKAVFAAFLDAAHARYRRILFMGGGGTDLLSSRWTLQPIAGDRFQVPEYDSPRNAYPRGPREKEFEYTLYAFGPPSSTPASPDLDIGLNDDLHVIRFRAKEQSEGHTFRWTGARSIVVLDRLPPTSRTLALWMNDGGRPPAAPPADVLVTLGDRVLGTVRVRRGFAEYDLSIPADLSASLSATGEAVRVTLQTTTWNPLHTLGTPDDRDLGIMLDRVAVR